MERERSPEEAREAALMDIKSKVGEIMQSERIRDDFYSAMVRFAKEQKAQNPEITRTALYHALIGSSSWQERGLTPIMDLKGEPVSKFVDEWHEKVARDRG